MSREGGDGGDRVTLAQLVRTGGSRKAGRGWTGAHTGSHGPRGAGAKSKEAEVREGRAGCDEEPGAPARGAGRWSAGPAQGLWGGAALTPAWRSTELKSCPSLEKRPCSPPWPHDPASLTPVSSPESKVAIHTQARDWPVLGAQ